MGGKIIDSQLIILILFFVFKCNYLLSQTNAIKGKVYDEESKGIQSVSIVAIGAESDNILGYTYSDNNGDYRLIIPRKLETVSVSFSFLGYGRKDTIISINNTTTILNAVLKPKEDILNEVIINSSKPIEVRKDTVIYNVKAFSKGNEQVVEDILKQLPGVEVQSDGTIKVQGKEVEKIMVEGDDFFEKGYSLLTKNMPSTPIKSVEVLKKYSNNKLLKGIEDTEKVALNLTLNDKAKRIWFGNVIGGYGLVTENIYEAKSNIMNFGKDGKYYILSSLNNIGQELSGNVTNFFTNSNTFNIEELGFNEEVYEFISLDSAPLQLKREDYLFNNQELVSVNTIHNVNKKLKVKSNVFFAQDNQDLYRSTTERFNVDNGFENKETYELRNNKFIGTGEFKISYDISNKEELVNTIKFGVRKEKVKTELLFNKQLAEEGLQTKKLFFDQNFQYTKKISQRDALVFKLKYLKEKLPEDFNSNQFFFSSFFSNTNNIGKVNQTYSQELNFLALEIKYLNNNKKNLFNVLLGNRFRDDYLVSSLSLKSDNNEIFQPLDYQGNVNYVVNDLYAKGSYKIKKDKFVALGKMEVHNIWNNLSEKDGVNKEDVQFYVNPSLLLGWEINDRNKLLASYSFRNTNSNLEEVLPFYTLKSSRSFAKGFSKFNQVKTSTYLINYNFGNWENSFFANLIGMYQKDHDFLSTNSIITQNYSLIEKELFERDQVLIFLVILKTILKVYQIT